MVCSHKAVQSQAALPHRAPLVRSLTYSLTHSLTRWLTRSQLEAAELLVD